MTELQYEQSPLSESDISSDESDMSADEGDIFDTSFSESEWSSEDEPTFDDGEHAVTLTDEDLVNFKYHREFDTEGQARSREQRLLRRHAKQNEVTVENNTSFGTI